MSFLSDGCYSKLYIKPWHPGEDPFSKLLRRLQEEGDHVRGATSRTTKTSYRSPKEVVPPGSFLYLGLWPHILRDQKQLRFILDLLNKNLEK